MDYERDQITFEIKEHIGVLCVYHTGWKKELNLVSWNGNAPKYDIRDWDPDHERMSRGITLSERRWAESDRCWMKETAATKSQNIQQQDQKRKWSDEEKNRRRES